MRLEKLRLLFTTGIGVFMVIALLIFLKSQNETLPSLFLRSSHMEELQKFKNQFLGGITSNSEKSLQSSFTEPIAGLNVFVLERTVNCRSPKHFSKRSIDVREDATRIGDHNIDHVIKESGLNLENAWQSPLNNELFSETAMLESELPFFKPRIPAIVFHNKIFIALCEARFEGRKDSGHMAIAMRRGHFKSKDEPVQWEKIQIIAHLRGFRTMNPSPVVDKIRNTILIVFAGFPAAMTFQEMMTFPSFPLSKLYTIKSYDLGLSWTSPMDITEGTILNMQPVPVLMVPGPGHSIQMKCGRLVVAVNYFTADSNGVRLPHMCDNCTNYVRVLYSDDGGTTWSVGEKSKFQRDRFGTPIHPNEVQAAEIDDNTLCLNARTLGHAHPRSVIFSTNGGKSLQSNNLIPELVEPGKKKDGSPMWAAGCAGSIIAFEAPRKPGRTLNLPHQRWVLFSNPSDTSFRKTLSFKLSIDGCKSWSSSWKYYDNLAAYSDLTFFEVENYGRSEKFVAVFHEGGNKHEDGDMNFRIFNIEAILKGIKWGTQDVR